MNIHVCVKQVPDITAPVKSDQRVMNAYDASALEASLVLREQIGGTVTVVSIGPSQVKDVLLRALAMGADFAYHIEIAECANYDSFVYASLLREHFKAIEFDVILCGKQAQDTDAGLTGPMLAEMIDLPYTTNVVALNCQDGAFLATRQSDHCQQLIRLNTPCLMTCSNDIYDPRIPSLKGTMSARKKPLKSVSVSKPPTSISRIVELEPMPKRPHAEMIEGESVDDQVATLVDLLQNKAKVL